MAKSKAVNKTTVRRARLGKEAVSVDATPYKPDFSELLSSDRSFVENGYRVLIALYPGKEEAALKYVDVGGRVGELREKEQALLLAAKEVADQINTLNIVFRESEKQLHGK